MRETGTETVTRLTRPTRRHVVGGIAGTVASLIASNLGATAASDNPPVFENERHQFTVLSPEVRLPATTLSTPKGSLEALESSSHELLLINIFATWCLACRTDLPKLAEFAATRPRVVKVAAVSVDRTSAQDVAAFVNELGVRHLPLYLDPQGILASEDAAGDAPLRLYGMPITYLITRSARIAGFIPGPADWLSSQGQKLLAYYANA